MDMLTMTKKKEITVVLAPFGIGKLQDLMALYGHVRRAGYNMEDVQRYFDTQLAEAQKRLAEEDAHARLYFAHAKRCPDCGAVMHLYPVNSSPRDHVGGKYKSQWVCPNPNCMETLYSHKTMPQALAAMGLESGRRRPTAKPEKRCNNGKA
jgi:hypothetical protein